MKRRRANRRATAAASAPGGETSAQQPAQGTATSDFGQVARKISRWSSNLVASAIVVVVCLTLGRYALNWHSASPQGVPPQISPLELPGALQFGEGGLRREPFAGDRVAAIVRLREVCRTTAQQERRFAREPSKQENRLVQQTERLAPVEEAAGKWQLYQFEGSFPLVVAFRLLPASTREPTTLAANAPAERAAGRGATPPAAPSSATTSAESRPAAKADAKGPGDFVRRLAAWGLAVPGGENAWSLYVFESGDGTAGSVARPGSFVPPVALPPGCKPTLTLQLPGGGAMMGFKGQGRTAEWMQAFGGEMERHGFIRVSGWDPAGRAWRARFRHPGDGATADIQFARDTQGQWLGFMTWERPAGGTVP